MEGTIARNGTARWATRARPFVVCRRRSILQSSGRPVRKSVYRARLHPIGQFLCAYTQIRTRTQYARRNERLPVADDSGDVAAADRRRPIVVVRRQRQRQWRWIWRVRRPLRVRPVPPTTAGPWPAAVRPPGPWPPAAAAATVVQPPALHRHRGTSPRRRYAHRYLNEPAKGARRRGTGGGHVPPHTRHFEPMFAWGIGIFIEILKKE